MGFMQGKIRGPIISLLFCLFFCRNLPRAGQLLTKIIEARRIFCEIILRIIAKEFGKICKRSCKELGFPIKNGPPEIVPEPATIALLSLGGLMLRKRKS